MRNRATFADASAAIDTEIRDAESHVIRGPRPDWMVRLTERWCAERAHVATFNYDLLLERSVSESRLVSSWSDLYAMSLEERMAPGSHGFLSANPPEGDVLRLYKLHGSINWAYGGLSAPTSDRVVLTSYRKFWKADDTDKEASRPPRASALYDDLVPLIIPPTASKNSYYAGLALRAQWRKAREAMMRADRVTIVGYSFPPSDLTARHFMAGVQPGTPVQVVTIDALAVETVERLLPDAHVVSVLGSDALEVLASN